MFEPQWEAMERAALEAHQLDRLRETLAWIQEKNEGYWRRLGIGSPDDVRSLDDLEHLPFLTKNDLRAAYPYQLACGGPADFVRMHMSSGTTGDPIIVPFTPEDRAQWGRMMARCFAAAGVGPEDVIQITPSFGLFNGGFGFHYGAETLGAMIIPIGAGRSQLQLRFLKDLRVNCITAIASYPVRLIEVAEEEKFDFGETELRVGIFGAEVWSDELRERIEQGMGITAYDIIGMTETGGVGLGIDCSERRGIHVWEDEYIVEMVHPETGARLPDAAIGEMVITTLTRRGLPLIRYRTGDITRVLTRDRCACGRTSMRIGRITGRTDDMLKIKGVNFYPRQVESMVMRHPEIGSYYQIALETEAGADRVSLILETRGPVSRAAREQIAEEFYSLAGFHAELTFVPEGTIERAPGKAVRVVDRRGR